MPRLSAQHTLVLPIPSATWRPPAHAVILDGLRFEPKKELHITLVGAALGRELRAAFPAAGLDAALDAAIAAHDWGFERNGRLLQLASGRDAAHADGSIIELIGLPAMAPLHRELGRLLGRELPVPPPHVTLYTRGAAHGIGVASEAALRTLAVREIAASEWRPA